MSLRSEFASAMPLVPSRDDLARLPGSLWGAATGAAFALFIACALFPPSGAYVDPGFGIFHPEAWARQELRERCFYLLAVLLGCSLGAVGGTRRLSAGPRTLAALIGLALIVPAFDALAGFAMAADRLVGSVATLAFAVLVAGVATFLQRGPWSTVPAQPQPESGAAEAGSAVRPWWVRLLLLAMGCAFVAALLLPTSFEDVAARIGFNPHIVSFVIGPATYFFKSGLVPGVDYFTQYSVGMPWLFSFFIAPTAGQTVEAAVRLVLYENVFFALCLFPFLWWLLRSWTWGLAVSTVSLLLEFTTTNPFYAPSSTAARYPLLMLVCGVYAVWMKRGRPFWLSLLLALSLAAALFSNTETGLYVTTAGAIATMIVAVRFTDAFRSVLLVGLLTLAAFLGISGIAFGAGAFSLSYVWYLFEPLSLYGSGLGAWSIDWRPGLAWLYNIVSPGVSLATVGWISVVARGDTGRSMATELASLAMVSLIGIFMTSKYINMSIVALWQVNAFCLVVVLAWWARVLLGRVRDERILRVFSLRRAGTVAVAALAAFVLVSINDDRNPNLYAVAAYETHPSLLNALLGRAKASECTRPIDECIPDGADPRDVALITGLTRPTDRVAIFAPLDWVYLIRARRASAAFFLPSLATFTERQYLGSIKDLDLAFMPSNPDSLSGDSSYMSALVSLIGENYREVRRGAELTAWQRIPQ